MTIGNLSPNNQTRKQKAKGIEQARKKSGYTCRLSKNPEDIPIPRINQQEQMRLHPFLFGLGSESIKHQLSEEGKLPAGSSQAWSP